MSLQVHEMEIMMCLLALDAIFVLGLCLKLLGGGIKHQAYSQFVFRAVWTTRMGKLKKCIKRIYMVISQSSVEVNLP